MQNNQIYVTCTQTTSYSNTKTALHKNIYAEIAKVVETRFDTSNYGLNRPLPKEKHEK